jgi:hypothetical protein
MKRLTTPLWISGGALALWLWIGVGFANYDTLYALVWGQQLGRGETPQYALPIAPTPHPLAELAGFALSPLGPGTAADATVAVAYLALAALAYLVYKLGAIWFSRAAGLVAAALVITREPVLSYGIRAYVDIPYVALVAAALLVETRRRRAGAPVLALLGVAGLLRPEAWLLAAAYWLWLIPGRSRRELLALAALAAAAPLLWMLADLLVTGNPLWSLTKTRSTAHTLQRVTGLTNVPVTGSRRLGEIMREPGLLAAAAGGLLSLAWLRERARLGVGAGVVAILAFAALATAGLPIVTRYMLLPAALLCVFAGAAVFGWRSLDRGDPRRRRWQLAGAAVALVLIAFVPSQARRLDRTFDQLDRQERIQKDLVALVSSRVISLRCGPVGVPNHRPVPLLALHLRTRPGNVVSAQQRVLSAGTFVAPANAEVEHDYTLDKHDPVPLVAAVPAGFTPVGGNASWRVYARCG